MAAQPILSYIAETFAIVVVKVTTFMMIAYSNHYNVISQQMNFRSKKT